jgi:hypothetical protein
MAAPAEVSATATAARMAAAAVLRQRAGRHYGRHGEGAGEE